VQFVLRDVPLDPLLRAADALLYPQMQAKGLKYTCVGCDPRLLVRADAEKLQQILVNLLTNANKYSPEGAQVRLSARRIGEEVEFAVSDDGPGLEKEELEHVFDRFWRAESGETQSGGTGLGLAIAKSLVELHGGAISANSTPGEGATFRFVLPIAKDGRPKQDSPTRRAKAGAAG